VARVGLVWSCIVAVWKEIPDPHLGWRMAKPEDDLAPGERDSVEICERFENPVRQ